MKADMASSTNEDQLPAEQQPPTKRSRQSPDNGNKEDDINDKKIAPTSPSNGVLSEVIAPHVLSSADALQQAYREAKPYQHGLISNLCPSNFLPKVLDEVKNNSKVTFKESDLFRVYQSIDLANLQEGTELAKSMPSLMKLRAALYSDEFRGFVEKAANLDPGTLTGQVDCAANCHARGCHLLCHDDVIGTRKVSYIIYLTDPDPEWTDNDGGRLELYESIPGEHDGTSQVPAPFPSKTVLPTFNSLAYFVVTPGVSFHSVQEVFADRPRLSIQGWYHAKETPEKIENATLNRLKSTAAGEDTEGEFAPFANGEGESIDANSDESKDASLKLSNDDINFLSKYMDKTYLEEKSIREISECFEDTSSVQLRHFFNEDWEAKVKLATQTEDDNFGLGQGRPSLDYQAGVTENWKAIGPAHKQRFLEYVGHANDGKGGSAGALMLHLKRVVLESPAFGRWLKVVTSLGMPLGYRGRVRRFRPGLDYTVAHYGILTQTAVLDATICFAAGTGKQLTYDEVGDAVDGDEDDAIWDSGDAGGFECYIAADDDEAGGNVNHRDDNGKEKVPASSAAADEYNEDDDTELLSVSASNNTLSLVYRDPGTMRFVKYVGSSAPSSRWDISLEYEVEDIVEDEAEEGADCEEVEDVGF